MGRVLEDDTQSDTDIFLSHCSNSPSLPFSFPSLLPTSSLPYFCMHMYAHIPTLRYTHYTHAWIKNSQVFTVTGMTLEVCRQCGPVKSSLNSPWLTSLMCVQCLHQKCLESELFVCEVFSQTAVAEPKYSKLKIILRLKVKYQTLEHFRVWIFRVEILSLYEILNY